MAIHSLWNDSYALLQRSAFCELLQWNGYPELCPRTMGRSVGELRLFGSMGSFLSQRNDLSYWFHSLVDSSLFRVCESLEHSALAPFISASG